ncbi:uncharacterized protein LOC141910032 [Tubulanus polymorphus]|uniref:uncharacterized protein LOC141910032 n=1 Tax=Tubulanus polymorphus TaxID=672921 RepID=UPI003DA37DD6
MPKIPFMSDLPDFRLTAYSRPFEYTGVDYLGPLLIKRDRSVIKRWVCLFTCLVTRSVHPELADSLETDSFMLVLRSFIGRRGTPRELYKDNGTNFIGAERELKSCLSEWNQSFISNFLVEKGTKWIFMPPNAPHFGGVWERLVRSVKRALKSLHGEQCICETVLRTTQGAINSRPLTYNSSDPNDLTPITPNHFLDGGASSIVSFGKFENREINSRKRWRQCQVLADRVWRRWIIEYLPSLTVRANREYIINNVFETFAVVSLDRCQSPIREQSETESTTDSQLATAENNKRFSGGLHGTKSNGK